MKLNRKLVLFLSLVLSLALATGGTLAYLSDTDADVNTMTLGNVYIVQNEQQRNDAGELVPFENNQPASPAVNLEAGHWTTLDVNGHEVELWEGVENAIDKIVSVTNTGKSEAYVRTLVAIESPAEHYMMEAPIYWQANEAFSTSPYPVGGFKSTDGHAYAVLCYTYPEALAAGETSMPSLLQVHLGSEATNEDVEALGETWDILVLSQAVQTAGFADAETALNTAFGEVNDTNLATWFRAAKNDIGSPSDEPLPEGWPNNNPPKFVTNADELKAALANATPGSAVQLAAGEYGRIELDGTLSDVTIMAGEGVDVKFNVASTAVLNNVTISNLTTTHVENSASYVDGGIVNIDAGADVNNLVIDKADVEISGGRSSFVGCSEPTAEVTIQNSTVTGGKYLVYTSAPVAKLTLTDNTISNISSWLVLMNAADSVGAQLTITGNTFTDCTGGMAKYLGSSQPEGAFTVFTDNTLIDSTGHDNSDAKWFAIPGATSTITVSGNTLDGAAWTPGTAQGLGK